MSPNVRTERKAQSTVVTINGELDEVLKYVKAEFVNYDPRGYGTSVTLFHAITGDYQAIITRANSCD